MKLFKNISNKIRSRQPENAADRGLPRLCYVHLPKCGGQSLVTALRQVYNGVTPGSTDMGAAIAAFDEMYGSAIPDTRERELEWSRYRQSLLMLHLGTGGYLIYGHHPCGKFLLDKFCASYRFITVMREPVSRFISNYVYDRTGPRKEFYRSDLDPAEELEAYLESQAAIWMANTQVAMLGGYLGADHTFELDLKMARENLHRYTAVGFTETMDDFASLAGRELGVQLNIGEVNTTRNWEQKQKQGFDYKSLFDDSVRKRIRDIGAAECELYEFAREQFNPQAQAG